MRGGIALVALSVLLAGCVSEEAPDAPVGDATAPGVGTDGPTDGAPNITVLPPQILAVHWNGTLGTYLGACDFAVTMGCQDARVVESANDIIVESPGTVLRAAQLTLTWDAASPATETLGFELMVMGRCDDCPDTMVAELEGPSPLVISAAALNLSMPADYVIHAYVYSRLLFVHYPPIIVYGNVDQALTVDGSLTVEPMPAPAPTA